MSEQDEEAMRKLKADPALEAEVTKMGQANLHPWVEKIQHKFGTFNVIRNARNQRQVDLSKIDPES